MQKGRKKKIGTVIPSAGGILVESQCLSSARLLATSPKGSKHLPRNTAVKSVSFSRKYPIASFLDLLIPKPVYLTLKYLIYRYERLARHALDHVIRSIVKLRIFKNAR
ncbi:hypothetical protein Rcae01_03483 [Novipirellula caenicola]|uniref:Uncharacterized protein n=1 Tax=Novipirellula caenicola TaxID=1536901 RepID=A0ABP9VUV2_9BACT